MADSKSFTNFPIFFWFPDLLLSTHFFPSQNSLCLLSVCLVSNLCALILKIDLNNSNLWNSHLAISPGRRGGLTLSLEKRYIRNIKNWYYRTKNEQTFLKENSLKITCFVPIYWSFCFPFDNLIYNLWKECWKLILDV